MKKILFVNPYASIKQLKGESFGCGAEKSLYLLIKNLDKNKYEPIIAYPFPKKNYDSMERYKDINVKMVFIPQPVLKRRLSIFEIIKFPFSFVLSLFLFIKFIKKERIEIVHTNTPQVLTSGIAAKILGITSIYHIRQLVEKPIILRKLLSLYVNLIADKIICISKPVLNMFYNHKTYKHYLIFNGIDATQHYISLQKTQSQYITIGTVGRIAPRKGYEYFIKAARIIADDIKNIKFMIVGDIENKKFYKYKLSLIKLIKELKLESQFTLTGWRDDIPKIMSSFDCFVMPSSSLQSPEPLGMVAIEAMATMTPVVATDSGGLIDIVENNKNGILVSQFDYKAIAEGVKKIIKNPELAHEFAINGRKTVEKKFDIKITVKEIEKIYDKCTS